MELSIALAGLGVLATIATPFLYSYWDNKRQLVLDRRLGRLLGEWIGVGQDMVVGLPGAESLTYHGCRLLLSQKRFSRDICGTLDVPLVGKDATLRLDVFNGVFRDPYVQLHYRNSDRIVRELGVMVLTLSDTADELNGYFAGWSPYRKSFVSGTVSYKRERSR